MHIRVRTRVMVRTRPRVKVRFKITIKVKVRVKVWRIHHFPACKTLYGFGVTERQYHWTKLTQALIRD